MGILSGRRHLGPFLRQLPAFLNHGEIDCRAGLIGVGEARLEDELVIMPVVEGAGPDDIGHSLGQGFAMHLIGPDIGAPGGLERPSRLGHGLDSDDALGDPHAHLEGRLPLAAMGDAQNRLVGGVRSSLRGFEGDMGEGRR